MRGRGIRRGMQEEGGACEGGGELGGACKRVGHVKGGEEFGGACKRLEGHVRGRWGMFWKTHLVGDFM